MTLQQVHGFVLLVMLLAGAGLVCATATAADIDGTSAARYQVLDADSSGPRVRLRGEPLTLRGRADRILAVVISADGTSATTIDGQGRLVRWDLGRPGERTHLLNLKTELACAVLSNDGGLLAFADQEGAVTMMQLATKEKQLLAETPTDQTFALALSSDGRQLAAVTRSGQVHVHSSSGDAFTLTCTRSVPKSAVPRVTFSPDGKQIAVASFSNEVRLFDPAGEGEGKVLQLGESRVTALGFVPDGRQLVVAGADGTTRVVDLSGDRQVVTLDTHVFAVWNMAFDTSHARLATASWDGTIRIWETTSWKLLESHKSHEESISAMAFGPNGGLVSASLEGPLKCWVQDIPSIDAAAIISGRADSVWVGVYAPGGQRLFVGGREKRFELWDVAEKKLVWSRPGQPTTRCAVFSPDGEKLATGGDDGRVILWHTKMRKRLLTMSRHSGAVSAVLYTRDAKTIVSVCDRGVVKLWDAATGEAQASWHEHKHQIYCANISPDGKWLFTAGGNWTTDDPGELIVWELETGRVRARLDGNRLAIWSIEFTPDGQRFATSNSSGDVLVWDAKTLTVERTLKHVMWIRGIAISPDGRWLAVGRGDGSVRLWDTTVWQQKASLDGHDSFTFFLQFSPDGNTLASSGNDGTVRFWPTSP